MGPGTPELLARTAIQSKSEDETVRLGMAFSENLQAGDVVALYGDMGSGKTTFVRGVCAGLGSLDESGSPTFTLINEYEGRLPIYHFDFYRINCPAEAEDLGCLEYFDGGGVCLLEWPDRVQPLLPLRRFEIHFHHLFATGLESHREIRISMP